MHEQDAFAYLGGRQKWSDVTNSSEEGRSCDPPVTSVAPATTPYDISASPGGCAHTQHARVAIFQTGSVDG